MPSKYPTITLPRGVGAKVVPAQPLVGPERDEIAAQVMRLKRADAALRAPQNPLRERPSAEAIAWAENWNLPREVFDYFTLEAPTAS